MRKLCTEDRTNEMEMWNKRETVLLKHKILFLLHMLSSFRLREFLFFGRTHFKCLEYRFHSKPINGNGNMKRNFYQIIIFILSFMIIASDINADIHLLKLFRLTFFGISLFVRFISLYLKIGTDELNCIHMIWFWNMKYISI